MFTRSNVLRSRLIVGRRTVAARRPMAISNKMKLVPCGDGDSAHLGEFNEFNATPRIELANGLFEIGRMEPADIVIPIPSVSGRHAMLRVDEDRITVTDLRSTNGTYVDGEEIEAMQAYEVTPGSRIIFGDEHLAQYEVIVVEDDPAEPAADKPAATEPAAAKPESEAST